MASFGTLKDGATDDLVRLVLDDKQVMVAKDYQVDIAYFEQPNAYSIHIGSGATALSLMKAFPKNTRFQLSVGNVVSFSGRTDGFSRMNAQATELVITGRDAMALLVDDYIEHDKVFNNGTFYDVTKYALDHVAGIKDKGQGWSLTYDDASYRAAVTGTPIVKTVTETKNAKVSEIFAYDRGNVPVDALDYAPLTYQPTYEVTRTLITGFRADKPLVLKAGETWFHQLKKEHDRGGIFMRAGVDPEGQDEFVYLLSAPNGSQPPLYGIINQRGAAKSANLVNCFQPKLKDNAAGRHARYLVYGRVGGDKASRKRIRGEFADPEMVEAGYTKRWVKVDETVKSDQHATYLAKKQCAFDRRKERSFAYSFRGHTLPMLRDPKRRAVVVPDTTLFLKDDEHGMEGVFWIERVSYHGSTQNGCFTELTLMLPEDLVFGDGDFSRALKKKKSIFGKRKGAV